MKKYYSAVQVPISYHLQAFRVFDLIESEMMMIPSSKNTFARTCLCIWSAGLTTFTDIEMQTKSHLCLHKTRFQENPFL